MGHTGESRAGKIAGLLLAAGESTRMGSPKQLLPLSGSNLLDIVLQQALRSDLDLVNLILGHKATEIRNTLKTDLQHPKLKITQNEHYKEGIGSSIRIGLSEVEVDYDHVMIILSDMPRLTATLINLLIYRFLQSHLSLGALQINDRRTHPVIIGRKFYPELRRLRGDVGARDLFLRYPDQTLFVETGGEYDDRDIDTLKDYFDITNETSKESRAGN
jgi:molybdenum cofactor cytidylyltransferase